MKSEDIRKPILRDCTTKLSMEITFTSMYAAPFQELQFILGSN